MNYVFKIQLLTHFKIFIEKTHWSHVVQQMILFPWRLRLLNALETSLQPLYHSTTAASSTSHTPAKTIAQLDPPASADFPTSVAHYPWVAMQWYRLLLLAAYGLRRMPYYALSMGMTQQFFVFCPR